MPDRAVPPSPGDPAGGAPAFGEGGGARWRAGAIVADRFRLGQLLGAGAMGEVWCAFDLELDETVALKRLRAGRSDGGRLAELFRREVRLARRVAHRNVARVFELVVVKGPEGPQLSLTMEYVRGRTLAQLLRPRQPFAPAAVVRLLREACAGLGAVHEAGVVHRDIKPGNVMLGEGERVVLMDFGVALAARDARSERGVLAGTPSYMAPELFDGAAATVASDVYALGCLGYELLTGRRAFDEPEIATLLGRKVGRVGVPPAAEVPGLAEVVGACLEPDPSARFASAGELGAALARLGAPAASVRPPGAAVAPEPTSAESAAFEGERPRVAVLPFEAAGLEPGLVELLVEDFAGELSRHKALRVLSAGPVRRVREGGGAAGAAAWVEAARELGASVVVGGEARPGGGGLELALRAVAAPDGRTLWRWRGGVAVGERLPSTGPAARSFLASEFVASLGRPAPPAGDDGADPSRPAGGGGPASSGPASGGAASSRAATAGGTIVLPLGAGGADDEPTRVRGPTGAAGGPRVLDLYLRGRALFPSPSSRDMEEAIRCFDEALAVAPEDPRIASALTVTLARYLFVAPAGGGAVVERAERAAEHALRVAPSMGEPHHARAVILLHRGRPVEAVRSLRRALRCAPSLAPAHVLLGQLLLEAGHEAEGRQRLAAAERLEPGNLEAVWALFRAATLAGREAEAGACLEALGRVAWGLRTHWSLQLRAAAWRRDRAALAAIERAAVAQLAPVAPLPAFVAFASVAVHGAAPAGAYATLRRLGDDAGSSMRTRCFHYQVLAELAGFVGDAAEAGRALRLAAEAALFDRAWLERCPLLACARAAPEYAGALAGAAPLADGMRHAYYSEDDLGAP